MQLSSLLYISKSVLALDNAKIAVNDIIATARDRNPGMGLTGALLFTGENFAQFWKVQRLRSICS